MGKEKKKKEASKEKLGTFTGFGSIAAFATYNVDVDKGFFVCPQYIST